MLLDSDSDGEVMSMFLEMTPERVLQFSWAVALGIGSSNGTKLKAEENLGFLPPIYSLRDETSFRLKLKERRTTAVKDEDT